MLKHIGFSRLSQLGALLAVVLWGVPAFGQGDGAKAATGTATATATATVQPPAGMPDSNSEYDLQHWALHQLWDEKFDTLELAANYLQQSRVEFRDGDWKLGALYNGVGNITNMDENAKVWFEKLNKWVKLKPESITPRVGLAVAWTNYAWRARGGGYAGSVTEEGWKLFRERLAEGRLVLREAKKLPQKCPHWWAAAQQIALGQEWPLDAYNGLFKEAIAFEPNYFLYYRKKIVFLLPRWNGDYGDAEQFAMDAANQRGGEAGDLLYARLIWILYGYDNEVLANPEVSFEKLDKGFTLLDKKYPANLNTKVMWARISYQMGTPKNEAARKARVKQLAAELEKIEPARTAPWRIILSKMREWAAK